MVGRPKGNTSMDHAVQYRDATGEVQLKNVPSLDAALELVERLRNAQGVDEVRVLREVPIEIRTYYRVVAVQDDAPPVPAGESDAPPPNGSVEVVSDPEPPGAEDTEVDEVAADAAAEVPPTPTPAADPDEGEPVVSGTMIMSPPPATSVSEPAVEQRRGRFGRG